MYVYFTELAEGVEYGNYVCLVNTEMLSPPTKSLDFRGFDSSKHLILKGGNSHIRRILQGVSRKV